MKKFLIFLITIVLLTGCKDNVVKEDIYSNELIETNESLNEQIEELKGKLINYDNRITDLEDELKNKDIIISTYIYEKEYFRELSQLSLEFSRARASGNIDKLRLLLSDNIEIEERNDEIFATYMLDEVRIEWPLYLKDRENVFKDMQINGFKYDEDNGTYDMYIQEYFINKSKKVVGIGFVYLHFRRIEDVWKIDRFEYDI